MKQIEDFMVIALSGYDKEHCRTFIDGENYDFIYSKIVVQFENVDDYERFEELEADTGTFTLCHDTDEKRRQYIFYSIDNQAFKDISDIVSDYDASIFQFRILKSS